MATNVRAGCLTVYFRVHECRRAMMTLVILVLIAEICVVSGDTVHLTMVTPTPYKAGNSQVTLSCFRSNPDTDIVLSFGRPFKIGIFGSTISTTDSLPNGSFGQVNGQVDTQYLTTDVDATGLFYCEGSNNGSTTRVYNIIHSVTRRFEPADGLVTRTVNKGEDVTLSVSSVNSGNSPLWRRIRNGIVTESGSGLSVTIASASQANDGDLYAVIQIGLSVGDNHFSMIRLIVRGCTAGKWGPPDCVDVCDMCYNGGVCDDETGQCICAPGFSEPNCLNTCGMHTFGWNCEFQCGTGNAIYNCTGSQFGLPDPYGSSCISGYSGRECDIGCPNGMFGAGCTQTCHCQSGTCDRFTGACTGSSGCTSGWYGPNCQIPYVCPDGYYGLSCLSKCHCLNDAACFYTGYCSGSNGTCADGFTCVSDPCTNIPCDNGGTCYSQSNTFICNCQTGFTGIYCHIVDNTLPVIYCPTDITRHVSSPTQQEQVSWSPPTVSDNSGIMPTVASNPVYSTPSGSFGIGTHSILYTATDAAMNQASCTFMINVIFVDNTLPVINCPTDIVKYVSSSIQQEQVSWYVPTVSDNSGIMPTVTSDPVYSTPSGSFSIGTHSILYTATDAAMNQASCTFIINVILDTEAPTVTGCPGPLTAKQTTGSNEVAVTWTEPLTYDNSGVSTSQTHQPGDRFPAGETNVTYTYSDQAGNQATCTFTVTVSSLPLLSQPPMVITVQSTSSMVTWERWGSNTMDTGDGPIIAYIIYVTPASTSSWITAGNVSVTDQSQAMYIFLVEGLKPSTQYSITIAAIRDGQGGEGPMSPTAVIQTLAPTTATTQRATINAMTTTQMSQGGSNTVLIAAVASVVVVVVIVALVILIYFLRVRRHRRQQPSKPQESIGVQELTSYENEITQETTTSSDYEKVGIDQQSAYENVGLPNWAHPWIIPWKKMIIGDKTLGSGHFGEVRLGGVMIEGELFKAAIKKLKAHASPTDRQNFLEEFRTMTLTGRHPNVVEILGACQHKDVLYVALEYLPNGDLRSYLRKARSTDDGSEASLSSEKLIQFALGVAKGMQHLAASGVIHRDLAARNILLDTNLVAKVSDFGLSRGEDIYVQMSKTRVPTRWLSLESLTSKTYTSNSDVWSYGILLWEIATLGGIPYSGIKTPFLRLRLANGYRMPKPSNCDDKIYDLMLQCWQEDPTERPSFKKLVSVLAKMANDNTEEPYMRILPRSEEYMYVNVRPELDDN